MLGMSFQKFFPISKTRENTKSWWNPKLKQRRRKKNTQLFNRAKSDKPERSEESIAKYKSRFNQYKILIVVEKDFFLFICQNNVLIIHNHKAAARNITGCCTLGHGWRWLWCWRYQYCNNSIWSRWTDYSRKILMKMMYTQMKIGILQGLFITNIANSQKHGNKSKTEMA